MTQTSGRTLPKLDAVNQGFWTSGQDDVLRFQRCADCGWFQHPPSACCSRCLSEHHGWQPVSGMATVEAVTINYQPWSPGMEVPYAIAIVGLDEQPGLRLTTNIVGVAPDQVHIGQRLRVVFEQADDVWLPLFTPV
jgi:uncharacterized OB-fold protein